MLGQHQRGGFILGQSAAGGPTLADDDKLRFSEVALNVNETALLATASEQQLAAIGRYELQASQSAGEVRYRQRQCAPVNPCAVRLDTLASQIMMTAECVSCCVPYRGSPLGCIGLPGVSLSVGLSFGFLHPTGESYPFGS